MARAPTTNCPTCAATLRILIKYAEERSGSTPDSIELKKLYQFLLARLNIKFIRRHTDKKPGQSAGFSTVQNTPVKKELRNCLSKVLSGVLEVFKKERYVKRQVVAEAVSDCEVVNVYDSPLHKPVAGRG